MTLTIFSPLLLIAWQGNAPQGSLNRTLLTLLIFQGFLALDRSGLQWQQNAWMGWKVTGAVYSWRGTAEHAGLEFVLGAWPLLGVSVLLTHLLMPDASTLRVFLRHLLRNALLLFFGLILALRCGLPSIFAAAVGLTALWKPGETAVCQTVLKISLFPPSGRRGLPAEVVGSNGLQNRAF